MNGTIFPFFNRGYEWISFVLVLFQILSECCGGAGVLQNTVELSEERLPPQYSQ